MSKQVPTMETPDNLMEITDREFRLISELVYDNFGINLTDRKKALVRCRLNKLVRSLGYTSFTQYYQDVTADRSGRSLLSMIDRITTNHTFFFRETDHFAFLRENVLPELATGKKKVDASDLRIWCAGCATGEEAYSLAMTISEFYGAEWQNREAVILATDLSLTALHAAVEGIYAYDRIRQVSASLLARYFKQVDGGKYAITQGMKQLILFKRLNFMEAAYPFKGKFHIVFLRNVMIYFDSRTRAGIIEKLLMHMHDGAYLFLGHSESLGREFSCLKYIKPAVYRKTG